MAYTYEWKLTALKKQSNNEIENAVVGTQWKVKATDEFGNSAEFVGATPFDLHTIDPETFTPYETLTETQVLEWIKEYVSGSNRATNYWDHIYGRLNKSLSEQIRPITSVQDFEFPWVSGSTEVSRIPT